MPPTTVAILGAGFIADIHLESYARFVPDAEVVAVYSRSAARARAFAARHHIPRWFDHLEQTIHESGCDVVDICVPNVLHHRATLAAAGAGKHVIIEKPLSMTLEEADEMIAACDAAAVIPCTPRSCASRRSTSACGGWSRKARWVTCTC